MQLKNKRCVSPSLVAALLASASLAGCSSPSATTDAAKSDAVKANAAPVGEGSTTRDQNLKNMPDDVRSRLQSQGQPVK